MDNIVVADKASSTLSAQEWGNLQLPRPGVVQMPIAPSQVASVARNGQDLVLTLKSGEQVTIGNFFATNAEGVASDMVFQGEDGALWQAQYSAEAFNGFTFSEISSIDTLVASAGVVGGATQTFAIAGLGLLGAGGAAAAASSGGGGGSGGSDGEQSPGTAPTAPGNLNLSDDGLFLSGTGISGATVNVRDLDGNLIGSGQVDEDGSFNIELNPPQTNGEQLVVDQTDPAGNASEQSGVSAPDTTAPDAPSGLQLSSDGLTLSGTGEPGATVRVRSAGGAIIGSAVVAADGTFSVSLDSAQSPGTALGVEQLDAAGNLSPATSFTAVDPAAPVAPGNLQLSSNGLTLSGTGQAGATVTVRDADGNVLGSAVVGVDGSFNVPLSSAQLNGQTLAVVQADADGRSSPSAPFTAADVTAPAAPGNLQLSADGLSLSGTGEAGTTVTVRAADGSVLGTALIGADGTFSVALSSAQLPGANLSVSLSDAAGNTSPVTPTNPAEPSQPAAPGNLVLSSNGLTLSGTGLAGATVTVRGVDGTVLGSALVAANGTFSLGLASAQLNGETLAVVQVDSAGRSSAAASLSAPDVTAPASPFAIEFSPDGSLLQGRAEPGSTLSVRGPGGTLLGSTTVDADGSFSLGFNPALDAGQALTVQVTDRVGNSSPAAALIVPQPNDITPPNAAEGLLVSADGRLLSGRGEAGAQVEVRDSSGNVIGRGFAGLDGQFNVTLSPPQQDGQPLAVTLSDAAGNTSVSAPVSAPTTGQQPAPLADVSVVEGGLAVTGRGTAGLRVYVRSAAGITLGSAIIMADGSFRVSLDPGQNNGEALDVVAQDVAGNSTANTAVQAPDTVEAAPVSNLVVSPDGGTLSGRGQVGAKVFVRLGSAVLAEGVVAADGTFVIALVPAVDENTTLSVTQVDASQLDSPAVDVVVPDATGPVAVIDAQLDAQGLQVSGSGVAGTTVVVRDAAGNELGRATVAPDGTYEVPLDSAQLNGQSLSVVVLDGDRESIPAALTAQDVTAPVQPTSLTLNPNGLLLNGSGEPGATVTIRDSQGALLGTGVVAQTGTFSVTLSSAATQGQVLQITLSDGAGNTSDALAYTVAGSAGSLQPSALGLDSSGLLLSGSGQAGSTISVTGADGQVLGSGIVAADGRFTITLSEVQNNGQLLSVVASSAGQTSSPASFTAPDTLAPLAVTDLQLNADRTALTGIGEPGATVTVRGPAQTWSAVVEADGTFSVPLTPPPAADQSLTVVQADPAGNLSPGTAIGAVDTTPPAIVSNVVIAANGSQVSGNGEPFASVQVRNAQDQVVGEAVVGANGRFVVTFDTPLTSGQPLTIVQIDAAGNESPDYALSAPNVQPPAVPVVTGFDPDGAIISGTATPGLSISVRNASGIVIGSGPVNSDASFSIELDTALTNGERVQVVQISGNLSSAPVQATAPDSTAPDQVSDLQVNANGTLLTGSGEPGSTVTVRGPSVGSEPLGSALVGADGRFSVNLSPAQLNGQLLTVTQADAAGNVSEALSINAPDFGNLAQPTDVALDADGVVLTGFALAGARLEVRGADGSLLGSVALIGIDGRFSVQLSSAQINGETLELVVIANGRSSLPLEFTAPDLEAPAAPTELAISPDGLIVSGRAEPGVEITVTRNGTVLGQATVGLNGLFQLTLSDAVLNGESVDVVASQGQLSSTPVPLDGPDASTPATPGALQLTDDGASLSGQATAGTTITVRNSAGQELASNVAVNSDGSFTTALIPPQTNGETLLVVAIGGNGVASVPATLLAGDTTIPLAPSDLAVSADGAAVTGRGEVGARVSIKDAQGAEIGFAIVAANGSFRAVLTPSQQDAQTLSVTQTDLAGNQSPSATTLAPDLLPPGAPTEVAINLAGTVVSGKGEAGAIVQVLDAQGKLLASGVVLPAGTFQISLQAPQLTGATLQVQLLDAQNNASAPVSLPTLDRTPPAPVTATDISPDGSQLTGVGEAGARVQVRNAANQLLGTAVVGDNGQFSVTLSPAPSNGETLAVVQIDAAGNTSQAVSVNADDISAPDPLSNVVINRDGLTVTGNGEPGATVFVRAADGSELGRGLVASNGAFSITLTRAQINAQVLTVNQEDPPGNEGPAVDITAPDLVAPEAPVSLALNASGVQLSGTAEAGSTVTVSDANGQVIGSATAAADGTFLLNLNQAQLNGQSLSVTARDAAGNVSPATLYLAEDRTPPTAVAALTVSSDGTTLSGLGEAGAQVEVRNSAGTLLGNATVAVDGSFSVTLSPAVLAGNLLDVQQIDAASNVSPSVTVTAPGNLGPAVPDNLALSSNGLTLSGTGSVGSTISVRGVGGLLLGTAQVDAEGNFSVALNAPQLNGQSLSVSAQANGLSSVAVPVLAPDSTAPLALTDYRLANDGITLTGRGEPGATVTVRAADGALLGSAVVAADGSFSTALSAAQLDGQRLTLVQTDPANNVSPAVSLLAPDQIAPAAPSGLTLNEAGSVLSGRGEVGATVTVTNTNGALVGTGVVLADGSFQVTLAAAQLNGQPLAVTLTDAAGNVSTPVSVDATDTTAPLAPSELSISGNGLTVSGRGEANATLKVYDSQGNLLGETVVSSNGAFTLALTPAQTNAQLLTLTLTDAAGNVSLPASLTAPDTTAPQALDAQINTLGTLITGTGEPGATVTASSAAGVPLGSTTVLADGSFSLTLTPAQINLEVISLRQADPAGNLGPVTTVSAPDLTPPAAATDLQIVGNVLSGRGEVNAVVRVNHADGTLAGSTTVGADGSFSVTLAPGSFDGSLLNVMLVDAASNMSPLTSILTPDRVPPTAVQNLLLDPASAVLSGTGEVGAQVEVRSGNSLLGSAQVLADGTFSISLDKAALLGQQVSVVQTDAAGNPSAATALSVPDFSVPAAPTVTALVNAGLVLQGSGQPGASVAVYSAEQVLLGSAVADSITGAFSVTLSSAQLDGEVLSVRQTSAAGVVSADASFTAPDVTPAAPVTELLLNSTGQVLTGKGQVGASVLVTVAGLPVGNAMVTADGTFSVTLTPKQDNGQLLSVTQTDKSNMASPPTTLLAVDLIAPGQPQVDAKTTTSLSGTAEAGSTVTVRGPDGTVLGFIEVEPDGTFTVALDPAQDTGALLSVVASDAAGNTSSALIVNALDLTPPPAIDAATLAFNSALNQLSGIGAPGAVVRVMLGNTLLGSALVQANGTFVVDLDPAVDADTALTVSQAFDPDLPSPDTSVTSPSLLPPDAPAQVQLALDGQTLTGQGPLGATIEVRSLAGVPLGSAPVQADGTFSISLQPAQLNGELLAVSASLAPNGVSIPVYINAPDSTAPLPMTDLSLNETGTVVTGKGEAGATVSIIGGSTTVLGSALVGADGTFSVILSSPQLNRQVLSVVQTDAAGNSAAAQELLALDKTPPALATNLQVNSNGTVLSGRGEANADVLVSSATGVRLGSGKVNPDGTFSITLSPAQIDSQVLKVKLTDAAGNASADASVTAPDATPPAAPTDLAVSANGLLLTGKGEAGARVSVTGSGGIVLGSALVASDGSFSVPLVSAQINVESLQVRQTDPSGNLSPVATVQAPDLTPPAIATNLAVSNGGLLLTGRGEVGANVKVTTLAGVELGNAVVGADGQFRVTLNTAQTDGQLLTVRLSDAAGNISLPASIPAPDTTPPAAPGNVQINTSGTLVSGTGIVGERILVRDANNTPLGTAVVGLNGNWSVILSPAQIDNQALQVVQLDLTGNASPVVAITAPDLTPPPAVSGLQLSANGLTLSGSAEANATITVKSAAGTTLGTAVAQANGSFSVTLSAAQINGEVLSIGVADRAGNQGPVISLTAPDIDADRPVVASNNLATATVNLAAVATQTITTERIPVLLGVGFTHEVNFSVASGTTASPTLTITDGGLLSLGTAATFTLQVKDASNNWLTLGSASNGSLLNLSVLAGSGVTLKAGSLLAGDYRIVVNTNSITVATTLTSMLQLDVNSLTQFTGTAGTAISGNVVTDPGPDGRVDITGPDNGAVVRIQNGGSGYVNAGTGTVVQGLYGALTIDAQGNYSYRANGTASSVGKVDVFSYQLVHPNGLSSTANLYVRIDSPQAAEVWNDANLAAPAALLDAINDSASTSISLGNPVSTSTSLLGTTGVLFGAINASHTFTVTGSNTVNNLKVLVTANNLATLLSTTTVELSKLNANGIPVVVKTVTGSSLLNLGGGQYGLEVAGQTAGNYLVTVRVTGAPLLSAVTVNLVNTTTYTNQQVVTGYTPVSGNLITGTAGVGADVLGSPLTVLSVLTAANVYAQPGYNGTSIAGTYGTLLVKADGSYVYTLNANSPGSVVGHTEQFTYKLTHPNGSSDTATLSIGLNQAGAASARMALLSSEDDDHSSSALALAGAHEVQNGTDGHDTLDGSQGGAVTLHGGAGDDTLIISDLNFASVDGGSGTDTLLWAGGDASIDLGTVHGRLSNIEIIDLNAASDATVQLTLNLADLIAVTEPEQTTLRVLGGEQDSVHLNDAWIADGAPLADGVQFTQYTSQEDPSHHLWVQNGIQVV